MFRLPTIHLFRERGTCPSEQCKMAIHKHTTPERKLMGITAAYESYTLTAQGKRTQWRDTRGHTWEQEPVGAREWGFVYRGDEVCPDLLLKRVLVCGCDWLVWIILQAHREMKPVRLEIEWGARGASQPGSLPCWVRGTSSKSWGTHS